MDRAELVEVAEIFRTWILTFSKVLFFLYPSALLLWTVLEGSAAQSTKAAALEASPQPMKLVGGHLQSQRSLRRLLLTGWAEVSSEGTGRASGTRWLGPLSGLLIVSTMAIGWAPLLFVSSHTSSSSGPTSTFAHQDGKGLQESPLLVHADVRGFWPKAMSGLCMAARGSVIAGAAVGALLLLRFAGARARSAEGHSRSRRRVRSLLSSSSLSQGREALSFRSTLVACGDGEQGGEARREGQVPRYQPPSDEECRVSPWHTVDIHVRTWLDQPTGLFRYINEIPRGALQKFELQTQLPKNVIREDEKGSRRLRTFGQPVPFNYGCFPQTFRDPDEACIICGCCGDDDPLDVIDLSPEAIEVGKIVCCRPLGAVCLIDEGQADWKIIVINSECNDPLASARSIEEVEQIAPGRINEALRWIDGLKALSGGGTKLLFEIHNAERAVEIIERDHAAWQRLCEGVGCDGTSKGHWIRDVPEDQPRASDLKMGLPQPAAGIDASVSRVQLS